MAKPNYPNWVRGNEKKFLPRLQKEMDIIRNGRENLCEFFCDTNGELTVEVILLTRSWNRYKVLLVYPSSFPYSCPSVFVVDRDVVNYCGSRGMHEFHHIGYDTFYGGIRLCVMNPNDSGAIGQGWDPSMTGKTILERAALWLHAYELKKAKPHSKWALPE